MAARESITVTMRLFTPRWGHEDGYRFVFTSDGISMDGPKSAHYNPETEWTGHGGENALLRIMSEDDIFAPERVQDLITSIWRGWRDGDLKEDEVDAALRELATWVDGITRTVPRGDLWDRIISL
jgi:hypothetical protein